MNRVRKQGLRWCVFRMTGMMLSAWVIVGCVQVGEAATSATSTTVTAASLVRMDPPPPEIQAKHREFVVEYLNKWNRRSGGRNFHADYAIPRPCNLDLFHVEGPERWRCKGTLINADETCFNRFRYVIRDDRNGHVTHGRFRPYAVGCA